MIIEDKRGVKGAIGLAKSFLHLIWNCSLNQNFYF